MTDPSSDVFPNGRDAETGRLVADPLSEDELVQQMPDLGLRRPTRRVRGPVTLAMT